MNLANFERGMVVTFAMHQARATGNLDCMKAVCYVVRNRVKAGWSNSWLAVISKAHHFAGNITSGPLEIDPEDMLLHRLLREIDDIYVGATSDDTCRVVDRALYYQFVPGDPNPWFDENIVQRPAEHRRMGQVGTMMLYL